nr:aldehyde dehydrogenase family protein [Sphingobium subterraneum]
MIGSQWVEPSGTDVHVVVSPGSGQEIGTVRLAGQTDIDKAVDAAYRAHESRIWVDLPIEQKAEKIRAARAYCEGQIDRLVELSANELGMPVRQSRGRHQAALTFFDQAIEHARAFAQPELRLDPLTQRSGLISREPVGVVAAITPFNGPFSMGINKAANALMAGCPVILKPSPEGALHTEVLAEAFAAADFPAGVISVLPGGRDAGSRLVAHPHVGMVTFTGSTVGGRAIAKSCAENFTRSSLELGGKSAAIICADADLDTVMTYLPIGSFGNAGQVCVTLSRIYVHRSLFDTLVERLRLAVEQLVAGDPADQDTTHGPIISRSQLDRINGMVQAAIKDGAKVVTGGSILDRPGFYFAPTILTNVTNSMPIVQEEVFGPVAVMLPFDDDDEAVRLANDSHFGLHGAIFTRDIERGIDLAKRVKTGTLALNGYGMTSNGPFGGTKWSGWGREFGPEGMDDFFELKNTSLDAAAAAWWESRRSVTAA